MAVPSSLEAAHNKGWEQSIPPGSTLRDITLPNPRLELDFRMCVQLEPRISVGSGIWGQRNWISFTGGHWTAPWGNGIVKPGGQDSQLVTSDLSTRLETNYLLQTSDADPAFIVVKTQGWRTGRREILEKLFDANAADDVEPSEYSFRLFISLETGDPRYSFLNVSMWVASGARRGAEVTYDAYKHDVDKIAAEFVPIDSNYLIRKIGSDNTTSSDENSVSDLLFGLASTDDDTREGFIPEEEATRHLKLAPLNRTTWICADVGLFPRKGSLQRCW